MALDLSLSKFINGSSGLLSLAVALLCGILLARGVRERAMAWGLALLTGGWGAGLATVNFGPREDPVLDPYVESIGAVCMLVAAAGGILLLRRVLPRTPAARATVILLPAVFYTAGVLHILDVGPHAFSRIAVVGPPRGSPEFFALYVATNRATFAIAVACAMALALRPKAPATPLVAVSLTMWPALATGEFAVGYARSHSGLIAVVIGGATFVVLASLWLRSRSLAAALVPLLCLVSGLVEAAIADGQTAFVGVVRVFAAAVLASAILRHDLLGASLAARTTRRGSTAIVALASLFVVAQVAIPFVSGGVGLALGGIVAAGLTLAGPLLQRAFDARPAPVEASDAKLATYRDAVRYALRDGVMTRKEEVHLASLAQHLGIGAGDAVKVRHEVEDERSPRS